MKNKRFFCRRLLAVLLATLLLGAAAPLGGITVHAEEPFATAPMIAANPHFSLALKSDGTVWQWGNYVYGGGKGPKQVPVLSGIVAISSNQGIALALGSDGKVWAWGSNSAGQLGDGTEEHYYVVDTPVQVLGLTGITAISAGGAFCLALQDDGTLWAWGANYSRQLGDGTTTNSNMPIEVQGLTGIAEITAGNGNSYVLKNDGTVWGWGGNNYGQLGDGTTTIRSEPVQVRDLTDVIAVRSMGSATFALKGDGTVWAWGHNGSYGDLGVGTTQSYYYTPVQLGLTDVIDISSQMHHSLALKKDGTVWGWGMNRDGQLGDGTYINRIEPVQMLCPAGMTAIVSAGEHSLMLREDGTVWVCGKNILGDDDKANRNVPVQVNGLSQLWVEAQPGPYAVTYNANGGAGAPAAQTKPHGAGISLSLQEPYREGYAFDGWALKQDAALALYRPGDPYLRNGGLALYAVWSVPVEYSAPKLTASDRYSFANAYSNFGSPYYYISNEDFARLSGYLDELYSGTISCLREAYLNWLQAWRVKSWGGSCFGMASTAILDNNGNLNMKQFSPGALNLWGVQKPADNASVHSAVNYYQISQSLPLTRGAIYYNTNANWSSALQSLVQKAAAGEIILFCYYFWAGGHAIAIHGYQKNADGSHNLIAYDNRYPNREVIVRVNADYSTCLVDPGIKNEMAYGVEFTSDMSGFEMIPINGSAAAPGAVPALPEAQLSFAGQGVVTVSNAGGESLTFDSAAGSLIGSMDVEQAGAIVNSMADGEPAPATFLFDVAGSQAYTFAGNGALDVSLLSEDIFAAAKSDTADSVVIDPSVGITVLGSGSVDFEASIGVNNGIMDMIKTSGTAQDIAQISLYGDGILIEAETGDVSLSVISNTVDTQEITVPNEYGNLLIKGDGSGDVGKVTILTSSKNDRDFDVYLLHEHNFAAAVTAPTCTSQGFSTYTCACGDSYLGNYVAAMGHNWGDWAVTTPATETAPGIETRVCKRAGCGQTDTRSIGTKPHEHSYAAAVTAPTCISQGYSTYTCACGDSYVGNYVAAMGHDWGDWAVTTPATMTTPGIETRVCKRAGCGQTDTRSIGTKPHEHSYAAAVTAPACTAQGFTTYTCACGHSYVGNYVAAFGHDWSDWAVTTPATKTTPGVETRVCEHAGCGQTDTRQIGIIPHEHSYAAVATPPACTQQGFTTYTCACGHSYAGNYVAALGHDWSDWAVTTPATKTAPGVETRVCGRDGCGETETRAIPKLAQSAQKWWEKLSAWLQWILRIFFFGWIWMK
ncbi:MAG: InlB B-repeat-containing protein [Clostridia bacterium]|nr:InlB B-repeat-containing protein [Clostridia bacterium]